MTNNARQSNKPFTVYRRATGEILRTGYCPETEVDAQASHPTIGVLAQGADAETQYVSDGRLVDIPPKPGDWAEFDFEEHQWVDPRGPSADEELAAVLRVENARAYLASTDWMVTRLAETGAEIPPDVRELRAEARKTASGEA